MTYSCKTVSIQEALALCARLTECVSLLVTAGSHSAHLLLGPLVAPWMAVMEQGE